MLQCSRHLCRTLLRRSCWRAARRAFLGVDRPVPDDIEEPAEAIQSTLRTAAGAPLIAPPDCKTAIGSCESCDDVCALFAERRKRLKPGELILLLSRIVELGCRKRHDANPDLCAVWPRTDFCATDLCNLQGKLEVMRLPRRVGDMYTDVISRVDSFSPTQLLYLLRLGAFIRGYHNRLLRSHAERVVTTCVWQLETADLCRSAAVLATRSENVPFAKLIGHVCLSKFLDFDAAQRLLVFRSLSGARHGSTLFLQGCVRHALNPTLFAGKDAVQALVCYARKHSACPPAVFESLLQRCGDLDLSSLGPLELCDLLWVSAKYSASSADLFERCEPHLLRHCAGLPGRSVAMLLWALAESRFQSRDLLGALESAAIAKSPEMSPTNVAVCAHSLSLVKGPGLTRGFCDHVEADVIAHIGHFNGLDLAMLAQAYARLGLGSATLHQCIQESALRYADDLPADCLSKLLWSYGHLVGRESFFAGLQFALLQRVHQFPAHELCRALWAYAVHRFFEPGFWHSCLSLLDVDQVRGNRRCSLLYPALSEVVAARKDLLNTDVLRLMNLTRSMHLEEESSLHCPTTADRIVSTLGSLGISASSAVDFKGFLIDASFDHRGAPHAVLVYTSATAVGSSSRPSGGMVLKSRFLRRHGRRRLLDAEELRHNAVDVHVRRVGHAAQFAPQVPQKVRELRLAFPVLDLEPALYPGAYALQVHVTHGALALAGDNERPQLLVLEAYAAHLLLRFARGRRGSGRAGGVLQLCLCCRVVGAVSRRRLDRAPDGTRVHSSDHLRLAAFCRAAPSRRIGLLHRTAFRPLLRRLVLRHEPVEIRQRVGRMACQIAHNQRRPSEPQAVSLIDCDPPALAPQVEAKRVALQVLADNSVALLARGRHVRQLGAANEAPLFAPDDPCDNQRIRIAVQMSDGRTRASLTPLAPFATTFGFLIVSESSLTAFFSKSNSST
ncbi:uncharacterized protein BcabD6B2_40420 [Babesia caballi]|uniref:Uncharacterized protein n=1 Tax=Babesia caballi TaxID=5871 RepID=A0AAV4LXS9_BABCB|nr:hypothetical protein, conserved [Babesia caballi]